VEPVTFIHHKASSFDLHQKGDKFKQDESCSANVKTTPGTPVCRAPSPGPVDSGSGRFPCVESSLQASISGVSAVPTGSTPAVRQPLRKALNSA
jgi:hypothetical protein